MVVVAVRRWWLARSRMTFIHNGVIPSFARDAGVGDSRGPGGSTRDPSPG